MATRRRAAGRHARVIESRRIGERVSRMAGAAIRTRRNVRERAVFRFADCDDVVVALHTLLADHLGARVIERAAGKRRDRRWIADVTGDAITRGRHVIRRFSGRGHPVVTCGAGQSVVCAPRIQGGVVEGRYETAAGFMALLTLIRRCRMHWAFADGTSGIACDMTAYALLGLDGRILVVDRIGLQEIASRRMTCIALPAVGVGSGVHRITRVRPRLIDRVVV